MRNLEDEIPLEDRKDIVEGMNSYELEAWFKMSPWYGSTANEIDWLKRVEMQALVQRYTTHSISATVNLPEDVTLEKVSEIYMRAWQEGLKGITIYRDGSRSGVLISSDNVNEEFEYVSAIKRGKELEGESFVTSVNKVKYTVIVGLKDNKPYEIFAYIGEGCTGKGKVIKKSSGKYSFVSDDEEFPITDNLDDLQEAITRGYSWGLRHRGDIKHAVAQLQKTKKGDFYSFNRALARILKKYIPNGEKASMKCLDCGSDSVTYQEGCELCLNCGSSKCG